MSAIDQMLKAPERPARVQDANLPPAKLPKAVKAALESYAQTEGITLSAVIRTALAEFMERRGIQA